MGNHQRCAKTYWRSTLCRLYSQRDLAWHWHNDQLLRGLYYILVKDLANGGSSPNADGFVHHWLDLVNLVGLSFAEEGTRGQRRSQFIPQKNSSSQ